MEKKEKLSSYDKIEQILEFLQLNSAEFAHKIGVSPTKIYDLKRGQIKKLSSEIMEKILQEFPDINPKWLLTGEGEISIINSTNSAVAVNNSKAINNPTVNVDSLVDTIKSQQETIRQQSDQIGQLIKMISHEKE